MFKRQFKTIKQSFWDEIYKRKEQNSKSTSQSIPSTWETNMSYKFTTVSTSFNLYIPHTVKNLDLIIYLDHKKKNWTRKYHKLIKGI